MIWDWLCGLNASDIRDVVLALAAPFAIWLAWRRLNIADRQEANTRRGQLNDKLKTGIELLGHDRPAVRQGAICVLSELARQHASECHVDVMEIFVSYLAYPPEDKRNRRFAVEGPDIQQIGRMFEQRSKEQLETERKHGFDLDLRLESTIFEVVELLGLTWNDQERAKREHEKFGSPTVGVSP